MKGKYQHLTRGQGQRELTFQQKGFKGGQVSDIPATDIDAEDAVLLDNAIAFEKYAAGRSGSQIYSNTALPGSGTVNSIKQHHISKKILLHRNNKLWISDVTMSAWTEVVLYGVDYGGYISKVDPDGVISSLSIKGGNSSNTNSGVLYWKRTLTGSTYFFGVYSDSARTVLVASATNINLVTTLFLSEENSSGISGTLVLTLATKVSSNAADTLTIAYSPVFGSFNQGGESRIVTIDENFIVLLNADPARGIAYVNVADQKFVYLNGPINKSYPMRKPLVIDNVNQFPTPDDTYVYGYRYLVTFCRIVDPNSGAPSSTLDRRTGALLFESAANDFYDVEANTLGQLDYAEVWVQFPVNNSDRIVLSILNGATFAGAFAAMGVDASSHYTHIGVYRTADIGVNGRDVNTGVVNDSEVYVWDFDFPIASAGSGFADDPYVYSSTEDDVLKARYLQGFGLKTRFFKPIPSGEIGEIQGSFILVGKRNNVRVDYCQLSNKENIGFNQPLFQFFKLDDGLKLISKSPDLLTLVCANKTYIVNPASYKNSGKIEAIFVLTYIHVASETIGVADYSSMTEMEGGTFVAICSDHSVRFWNGSVWGADISSQKVNKIIRTMVAGTVVGYFAGSFHIWYRDDSSQTYNNKCLRYGMGRDNGFGWSQVSGSAWLYPYLLCGSILIQDTNTIQRLLILDSVSNLFYWIETFTSFTGSGLSKLFKDKVATNGTGGTDIVSRIRFRELIGQTENETCYHEQTNGHVRPYDENVGYLTGFKVNMKGYADGNPTPLETVSNVPKDGDYQFWTMIEGFRIQVELTFDTSGYLLTTVETIYQSMKKIAIGKGPASTDEAAYQLALAGF